ncbi:FkbM family methyltransferase [Saccharothrix australiensis]|uniref:FkbM family methyltransferase n=1 Tax=Saccharothrix australiensis TaxID=2072 RepID=A0A495VW55_9PSEU|nr:FkbM family methyltransferase [Saccharothrix australiensis]RKT52753.1 FkbM family methyltransferase [Saccharothrix australiensis]
MSKQPVRVVHTGHSEKLGLQTVTEVPASSEARPALIACTVATAAELPAVKVLSSSFLANHPEARFLALVVDALPENSGPGLVTPADLGIGPAELAELATGCTAAQLCGLLRPKLLEQLLGRHVPVLYLDPWVLVLGSVVDRVLAAVDRGPLVLLPRALRPLPDDGLRPTPAELLGTGVFDPGFLVVAPGAEPFLRSLHEQLRRTPDATKAVLDTAPALVDVEVLRDASIGLSAWNAHQRPLHRLDDGTLTVLGEPLLTVHFQGFDPGRPWLLSTAVADRPRVLLSEHPRLAELCTEYRAELVRRGYSPVPVRYGFGQLADGTPIPDELRADYREAARENTASAFHPPLSARDDAATEQPPTGHASIGQASAGHGPDPAARVNGTPVGATRPPVPPPPPAFAPDGGEGFLAWACEPAPGLPGSTRWAAALWRGDQQLRAQFPDPFGADGPAFRDWCAGAGVATGRLPVPAVPGPRADAPVLHDQLGVSVIGVGPAAELLQAAARASGLPMSTTVGYPVVVRVDDDTPVPAGRFVVDYRLDEGPAPDADELWVPSEATRAAVERAGGPAVRVLPLPVLEQEPYEPEEHEGVVFGALADHEIDRDGNVIGAVSAFLGAFTDQADVRLRIAVTGAADHPEAAERLRLATAADPRVELVAELGPVDCLISLHRGRGDRVTAALAEHAARGVPVLVPEHGAVAELFDKHSVVFVPCRQGAEPDVQAAVKLLRALADDLPAAREIGAKGRQRLDTRTTAKVGDLMRERVEHAYRTWRARRAAANPSPTVDPLKALHSAKHALLRQPDVGVASRTPMAPQLRKMVLRVLDHYDNHMRDVLASLVDGVERTVSDLVRRQDDLSAGIGQAELEALRSEVEQHLERQGRLSDQVLGLDDDVVRVRADMAGQGRRLREIEDAVVAEAAKRAKQGDALAQRIDKLTVALERTLDRIDTLESKVVDVLRERDTRLDAGMRAANQAQQTADALRRVVVREHERHGDGVPGVRSSLVLTEVGLLRLPSDDAFMLPILSSNGVWEQELSELIDSVVEPDGIFLDVGAYVGYQTVRMLSRFGTGGAVVAVEPCPSARELLRHNVLVNLPERVAERLVVVDAAAWESVGELATRPALTGGVSVAPVPEEATDVARVRAARLDKELEAVPELHGRKLSVVRVDAPGRGHRALAGLVRLLRRDRPHVFLEFSVSATEGFGDDPVTVLKEFRVWGYDLVPVATREPASPEQIVAALEGMRSTSLWLRPRPVQAPQPGPQVAVPLRQPADQAI